MDTREQLEKLLSEYIVDTLHYIHTVRDFCDKQQKWTLQRETELAKIRDIKQQADRLNLFEHVKNSKKKGKAFGECMRGSLTANSRYKKLEEELGAVLKDILEGLEKLHHFLDAVEKLSVTSQFVFTKQSFLPKIENPESVQSVIAAAITVSPLLIHFKRNAETFFFPAISNVDVLAFHLDKYIHITKEICGKMGEKFKSVSCSRDTNKCKKAQPSVRFSLNVCEDSMLKMLDHLNQLTKTRMDQNIRLTFLFQKHAQGFIDIFSKSHSRMEQFLSDLEEKAVQLDKMKKGANISSVAGSSVGIAGGVFSILGLALAPITAGASLALTLTGVGLGVTSGLNSLVTGITEVAVNRHHGNNAQGIFRSFMDDVTKILDCLEQASNENIERLVKTDVVGAGRLIMRAGGLLKGIDSLVDTASAIKVLKNEEVIATAAKVGLQEAQNGRNIPKLAADLPDIGQLAKGTPLALSKSARAGFITVNALFIGLDDFFIYKDSKSLAKGSPCQASQLIRSRAALWKSELEAWRKIHDSLCIGNSKLMESQKVLEQPFFHRIL